MAVLISSASSSGHPLVRIKHKHPWHRCLVNAGLFLPGIALPSDLKNIIGILACNGYGAVSAEVVDNDNLAEPADALKRCLYDSVPRLLSR